MAELMEERLRIVQRDQHRLTRGALHEVVVVRTERGEPLPREVLMAPIGRRPGAGTLSSTCEVVAVKEPHVPIALAYLPDPHIRVEDRDLTGDLVEGQAVQLLRRPEDGVDHV